MDVGIASGISGNHARFRIVFKRTALDVANNGIAFGNSSQFRFNPERSPAGLTNAAKGKRFITEGFTEGNRHFGERGFIARPSHEIVVLALIVKDTAQAQLTNRHHGRIKQPGRRTPSGTSITGFFW